jgi:hypothetical protein
MFEEGSILYVRPVLSSGRTKRRGRLRAKSEPKKLRRELREFLDSCVVPALVEKYLAKK